MTDVAAMGLEQKLGTVVRKAVPLLPGDVGRTKWLKCKNTQMV